MEDSASLYDSRLQSKELSILKTALPYMNSTAQRNLSMIISYLQLQKTIEYFNNPDNTMQICAMEQPKDNSLNLLKDLKKVCSQKEQQQIDMVLSIMEAVSVYDVFFQPQDV